MIRDTETGEVLSPQAVADQLVKELGGAWVIDKVKEESCLLKHPAADDHAVFVGISGIDFNPQVVVFIRKEFSPTEGPLKDLKVRDYIFVPAGRSNFSKPESLVECVMETLNKHLDTAIRATEALKKVVAAQGAAV